MIPYEWKDHRGARVLSDWDVPANQMNQLKIMLIQLERMDLHAAVGSLIFKTKEPDIYYSKINGQVALRPRCCVGPPLRADEVTEAQKAKVLPAAPTAVELQVATYLERVAKKGGKEKPSLGKKTSSVAQRLEDVRSDSSHRSRITMHRKEGSA